jgi:Asp-tRNA(Asn)/Glu-tRNA(Gln) amidotransferase A subunit family amidase
LPGLLAALAVFDPACNVAFPHQLLAPGAPRAARRLAFAVGLDAQAVRPHVVEAYNRGIEAARRLGAQLVPLDLRAWDLGRLRRAVLALCEQTMWIEHGARIAAQPEQFSDGLRAFIRYGGKLEPAEIEAAELLTVTFARQFAQAMLPYDALLLPTVPCTAFAHGERHPHSTADLTTIASVTGDPAITIPLPHPAGQLPAGLQLIGRTAGDYDLIQLAIDLEKGLGRPG